MVGTTLCHYRIVRALGEGGMGEVYAAEDIRLHRVVALKLLPREMAFDPERLDRFRREAQAVAALNHPNIVTLYEVEEADGLHFFTMELVEGPTLAASIPPGGLPVGTLLPLAIQLADAVSAAHQRGIIHRDLKPTNVMLSADGRLKVLDFGIAKIRRPDDAAEESTRLLTGQQRVIGTASYMSPEQAEGRLVDARSDVFSLGVVLYEMATGARPFRGTSAVSILTSILRDTPPPPSTINRAVPPPLDRIVKRCLAKDPQHRYQSVADLRHDLEDLHEAAADARRARQRRLSAVVSAAALVAAVGAMAVGLTWLRGHRGEVAAGPRAAAFARLTAQPGVEWFPSFSPDGKWIIYAADGDGARHIYLQSVSGQTRLDLTPQSTWDEDQPAFSPDGERIAFRSARDDGGIFVMGRTGEAVRRVTREGFRPTWSPDGTRIAYTTDNVELNPQNSENQSALWIADVASGTRRRIAGDAVLASWSPHDLRIAYTQRQPKQGVWTVPVHGGVAIPVTGDRSRDWNPAWSPDGGYLYFVSDRSGSMNLWRVAIDEATGRPLREAEPITTPATSLAHPAISPDGRRVVYTSELTTTNIQGLSLDPRTGVVSATPVPVTTGSRRWSSPDPSPDGRSVVFYSLVQPEGDLYVAKSDGTGPRQITSGPAINRVPRWSPDGNWIAFFSDRPHKYELWKIRPDGSGLQQITDGGGTYLAWSPDATRIATSSGNDVVIFDPRRSWASQTIERLPAGPARMNVNSWSPDGARLAGEMPRRHIVTYAFASRRYDAITDFGEWPVWLPDSRRLLFVADGKALNIVDTVTKQTQQVYSTTRDVIGPPRLTRDGRTMYFSRRTTEADLWMLTLK